MDAEEGIELDATSTKEKILARTSQQAPQPGPPDRA
jgi:hypothetical protein